ncbi:hypothetical protein BC332_13291 [Capsicum chinense]|nr:hypothetical protein BC332_13291 [Capsicum chinense]
MEGYSRKLVKFCCSKALIDMYSKLEDKIENGDYIWLTIDMMLAWEIPSSGWVQVESVVEGHSYQMLCNFQLEPNNPPIPSAFQMSCKRMHDASRKERSFREKDDLWTHVRRRPGAGWLCLAQFRYKSHWNRQNVTYGCRSGAVPAQMGRRKMTNDSHINDAGTSVAAMHVATTNRTSDPQAMELHSNGLTNNLYNVYSGMKPSKILCSALERKFKTEDYGTKKFFVARFLEYKMIDSLVINEAFQVTTIIEKLPPM